MDTVFAIVVLSTIAFILGFISAHVFPWRKPISGTVLTRRQLLYIGLGDVVRKYAGGEITQEQFITRYKTILDKLQEENKVAMVKTDDSHPLLQLVA